jgi:extradiol dioxygenase family protein
MPWQEFNELVIDLQTRGIGFYQQPCVINEGERDEQAKFYLKDGPQPNRNQGLSGF